MERSDTFLRKPYHVMHVHTKKENTEIYSYTNQQQQKEDKERGNTCVPHSTIQYITKCIQYTIYIHHDKKQHE